MSERPLHMIPRPGQSQASKPGQGQNQAKKSVVADINEMSRRMGEAYLPPVGDLLDHTARVEFIVPGAIPKSNIIILTGEPGAKKTWAAYSLMLAVASGGPWLGRGENVEKQPVVLLNYDQPTETLATRMRKMGFTKEMPLYVHTLGLTKPPLMNLPEVLTLPDHESRLNYALTHVKPRLIVVDSLRQSNTMDENNNQEMAALMGIFKRWQRFNQTTIVLIHHTPKSKDGSEWTSSARGAGEIIASADAVIKAAEDKLRWTKTRTWKIDEKCRECSFELADQYLDGEEQPDGTIPLIERVNVLAKTPLPGEERAANIRRVVETLAGAKGLMNWTAIRQQTGFGEEIMKLVMRDARASGAIQCMKMGEKGRGYRLPAC